MKLRAVNLSFSGERNDTWWCDPALSLTVIGLGTAATTMPIVGWGDGGVGLPQDTPSSAFLICPSPGRGDVSFCSCCFLWIFLWSCCFASTDGEDSMVTWGWKEWASAARAKAETVCEPFTSEENQKKFVLSIHQMLLQKEYITLCRGT